MESTAIRKPPPSPTPRRTSAPDSPPRFSSTNAPSPTCRHKNVSLFNTANEILDRYESYALGKALGAREPFIGTTRVKIENQVQGYKDRILDQRIQAPTAKP